PMIDLVGRADELATLSEGLDEVEEGRFSGLVVRGVPGVGKSRLLDQFASVARTRGFDVVRAAGTEFEHDLPYNGLASIVGTRLDLVDELDPRYAQALQSALGLSLDPTPQLAVGMALLTFLATWAERSPLLVIVDDLHW